MHSILNAVTARKLRKLLACHFIIDVNSIIMGLAPHICTRTHLLPVLAAVMC
jgi:hypothetical protein